MVATIMRYGLQVRGWRINAVHTGIVMAVLAVLAGAIFEVRPPEAYGICTACHGRDLMNWVSNESLGTHLSLSPVSLVFPLLTTVGMIGGALTASITSGEFRWRLPENPIKTFLYGIIVMNFALLAAGCSIRLLLRTASGELLGMVGFSGMVVGVIGATLWLKWEAQR